MRSAFHPRVLRVFRAWRVSAFPGFVRVQLRQLRCRSCADREMARCAAAALLHEIRFSPACAAGRAAPSAPGWVQCGRGGGLLQAKTTWVGRGVGTSGAGAAQGHLYASSPFGLGDSSSLLDSQLQHVTSPWNSSIGAAAAGSLAAMAKILLKMEPMALCLYFIRKRDPFFEAMHKDFVRIHLVREDR